MNDLTEYIDPFLGNGAIDLPEPEGIAATWFFPKAQTGNTHPGACSPFGMVSACAYSGAYVTGYGLNTPNTHGQVALRFDDYCASGFTHFHHSGTGRIRVYYNYFRVTPLVGGLSGLGTRWALEDQEARPGYYSAKLKDTGIKAELTVSPKAAFHRYIFPEPNDAKIVVDFSSGGLDFEGMGTIPTQAEVEVVSSNIAQGYIVMEDIPFYVYLEADFEADSCNLWSDDTEIQGESRLELDDIGENDFKPFGVVFNTASGDGKELHLRIGFSLRSIDQAKRNMGEIGSKSFDEVAEDVRRNWNEYCSRIVVEGGSEEVKEIFYSALYHSLIKPIDCSGESPFWDGDGALYVDFATMWDQYKTHLPLILSLYPEHGAAIVNSILSMAEYLGEFSNGLLLSRDFFGFENQARALAHHVIADAFNRRLDGIDWERALDLMITDIHKERNRDFLEGGIAHPYTHTLDLADACICTARIADYLGDEKTRQEMVELGRNWKNVYDPETATLGESKYYEGVAWNYSFRLMHDMVGRIGLYKSEEDFVAALDSFFGYGGSPVKRPGDPKDIDFMKWGFSLNRFEGFNNEPDIEVPYAYIYAGRHDRTAEVVRAGMKYTFTTGRGGLPGNDDSGGLSSCYVWNAIGLFPVSGGALMLIGSPLFDSVSIRFGGETFVVEGVDNSDENIYVLSATLNGKPIDRAYLSLDEVMAGGTLSLVMGPEPSTWARSSRPPSYPNL